MRSLIKSFILILIGVGIVLVGYPVYKKVVNIGDDNTTISSNLLGNYIKKSQELVSYKYFYTNAAMFENKKDLYGFELPLTSKKFILSYNGRATLGVDLKDILIDISGNKIIISNLGNVQILSNEIDESSIKIFDERTSLFSSWNIKDYQKFFTEQKAEIEKKVKESNLLIEAKSSAEEAIKRLLMLNPQISSKYEIEFKD
nr:DUF4230 domain-containing protein [uncultured Haemophilus sp.]